MIKELFLRQEVHDKDVIKNRQGFDIMVDHAELSLGPPRRPLPVPELESHGSKKRKYSWEQSNYETMIPTSSIELQAKESLPLDWEQCLDLQSGRMYYLNRKTLKKSSKWPKDQKLDLELNISTPSSTDETKTSFEVPMESKKRISSSSNMVAVACMKCHLLVMLCRSSPSCPNCKYVHSLLPAEQSLLHENTALKPFNNNTTLSLLN